MASGALLLDGPPSRPFASGSDWLDIAPSPEAVGCDAAAGCFATATHPVGVTPRDGGVPQKYLTLGPGAPKVSPVSLNTKKTVVSRCAVYTFFRISENTMAAWPVRLVAYLPFQNVSGWGIVQDWEEWGISLSLPAASPLKHQPFLPLPAVGFKLSCRV